MVNTNFAGGILGVDLDRADTTQQFDLGTCVTGEDGSKYVYVTANGAVTGAGYVVLIPDNNYDADLIDLTNSASAFGEQCGVAMAALADNEFGWAQVYGHGSVRVAASAAANATLNTTSTSGQLDDDAGVGSEDVDGIVLTTANGGSAATAAAFINFPTVGATN